MIERYWYALLVMGGDIEAQLCAIGCDAVAMFGELK